jgi:hypothetical protein
MVHTIKVMFTTPHVLLGLYFATHFRPEIALPAALISHFLFDYFYPHWNPHLFTEMKKHGKISTSSIKIITVDLCFAVIFLGFFVYQAWPNLNQIILFVFAAILADLPDIVEAPFYFLKSRNPTLLKMVNFEHKHQANASKMWGLLSQALIVILCLWQLIK